MKGIVFDIQRFCLHDGPGIRTTVFLKGCTLRCRWCHNPEGLEKRITVGLCDHKCVRCGRCFAACPLHTLNENAVHYIDFHQCTGCGKCVQSCPSKALYLSASEMEAQEVADQVLRDRAFYGSEGGVTFSGGEPLVQASFVKECATLLKAEGLTVAVDTCGNVPFEAFETILPVTDLFLFDIKTASPQLHVWATDVDNRRIQENLQKLDALGVRLWIRIPIIHGVNDSVDEIEAIADIIAALSHVERVTPIPYHDLGGSKYEELGIPSRMSHEFTMAEERISEIRQYLSSRLGASRVN